MRVLQLIDSLRPGGAEKMAVNIANALLPHVEGSFLCCTRHEGMLKDELKTEVTYFFLNKKHSIDPKAIVKLRKFIRQNNIDVVHAHSTSFFLAGLLKISGIGFKLIWHDHYGESENLENREFKVLKNISQLFAGIISVNTALKDWAIKNLNCPNVIEIKNFISEPDHSTVAKIILNGNEDEFKIICVANLRPQKDHLNLLRAFHILESNLTRSISLHLIGEDPKTDYSASVLKEIEMLNVNHKIHFYGIQAGIILLLQQADLGVLSSRSEGLPLALLEYGLAGLPVVCTDVGQCAAVINGFGVIVEKENSKLLCEGISLYIKNREKMKNDSKLFKQEVETNYFEKSIIRKYTKFVESVI